MTFVKLSKKEKIKFWNKVEIEIKALLLKCGKIVPSADTSQVLEYLDNNELGLALDHLSYSLIENDISIGVDIGNEIFRLMDKMEYNADEKERIKNSLQFI